MRNISLADISRFRSQHMGVAMIVVILFHVYLSRHDPFFGLHRIGNIGVDMFLFLSGIGLWYSWTKQEAESKPFLGSWAKFYWRRLTRVYPAWFVVACLYYIPLDLFRTIPAKIILSPSSFTGDINPAGITEALGDILINWDFWLHDEGTFWYIPATMMLYIFAPPYMSLIRRQPVYRWLVVPMIMWCIIVQYVTPIHHAVSHIEIFWSRVPIFFLGLNIAEQVRQKQTVSGQAIWIILLMFVMSLATCVWLEQQIHGRFPLFLERMLYIPLTVTFILLLGIILQYAPRWINTFLAWVGTISLEVYLIHIEFVLKPIQHYHLGYWPTTLLTILLSLPLAWLLHKGLEKLINHSS